MQLFYSFLFFIFLFFIYTVFNLNCPVTILMFFFWGFFRLYLPSSFSLLLRMRFVLTFLLWTLLSCIPYLINYINLAHIC